MDLLRIENLSNIDWKIELLVLTQRSNGVNKKTPAEKAGILIDGNNKWIILIQKHHVEGIASNINYKA